MPELEHPPVATRVFAPRVLTGDRPTGQLHLGHLFGTLLNRVRLQDDGVELMVLVADYQTITDRDSPASLPRDVEELVADYLAVGIDPQQATIFAHSQVPELNQLILPFLSLVTLPELLRNPTVKEEAAASGMTALNGLMLTYPVHQAADILFCQATLVPVGADQLPHVEQTRAIARRFNRRYAPNRPVFPEPEALLSNAPTLLGIDGRKMSKSRNNAIALAASAEARQHDQAMLLVFVQALVERAGRIGELLELGAAFHHHIGAQVEPLDRILRPIGAGARGKSLGALLGEIAKRAFHGRPVFLLLGIKLESGMNGRDTRVTEGNDISRARFPARREVAVPGWLLRVGKRSADDRQRCRSGKNSLPHGIPPKAFLMLQ